ASSQVASVLSGSVAEMARPPATSVSSSCSNGSGSDGSSAEPSTSSTSSDAGQGRLLTIPSAGGSGGVSYSAMRRANSASTSSGRSVDIAGLPPPSPIRSEE